MKFNYMLNKSERFESINLLFNFLLRVCLGQVSATNCVDGQCQIDHAECDNTVSANDQTVILLNLS